MSYTDEDIKRLEKLPGVLNVTHRRIALKLEFKLEVYDEWFRDQNVETIRRAFAERGTNPDEFSKRYFAELNYYFLRSGRPVGQLLQHIKIAKTCLKKKSLYVKVFCANMVLVIPLQKVTRGNFKIY